MSLAEKKEVLLHIVEDADEKLMGLLIALANEYNQQDNYFTEAELTEFNRRKDEYFKNPEMGISMEESLNRIRQKYSK